jgi:hypothetical protein
MNQSSISTNNKINTHHNIASNSNTRWVPCTAKADFWGDGGASQLSFRKDSRLEIDLLLPPQNGWRWGMVSGRAGWLPEWAAEPLLPKYHKEQKESLSSSSSFQRHHQHRSNKRNSITSLEDILECILEDPSDGSLEPKQRNFSIYTETTCDSFDTRNNEIMGGTIPLLREPTSERRSSEEGDRIRPEHCSVANEKPMSTQNPYTTDQDQPDWDGSEVPQIWVDGSVTVLEADGKTSSYRNEKSYLIAEARNKVVEQCQTLGKSLSGFKLSKSKQSRGTNDVNSHKLQQTPANSPTKNKPRKQPFGKNGALKFPKMSSFPKKSKAKGKS